MAVDLDDTAVVRWRASPIAFIEEMLHLQIGSRHNHRDARIASITPARFSTSTSVRITTSLTMISSLPARAVRLPASWHFVQHQRRKRHRHAVRQ